LITFFLKTITVNCELCEFTSMTTRFQWKCAAEISHIFCPIRLKRNKVVYILYARYQTSKMPAPKMRFENAKSLQKNRYSFCSVWLVMHWLWIVQRRHLATINSDIPHNTEMAMQKYVSINVFHYSEKTFVGTQSRPRSL